MSDRSFESRSLGASRGRLLPGALEPAADPEFHFPGGLLGEGQRHDAVDRGAPLGNQRHHAPDHLGGLAGAGCRLDDDVALELGRDRAPGVSIRERWLEVVATAGPAVRLTAGGPPDLRYQTPHSDSAKQCAILAPPARCRAAVHRLAIPHAPS
jgi:hypothetical protein